MDTEVAPSMWWVSNSDIGVALTFIIVFQGNKLYFYWLLYYNLDQYIDLFLFWMGGAKQKEADILV